MAEDRALLPEGTVTVLSTDLVGSTALNQRLGDEAATSIEREVETLALEHVERQRGVVVKHTGDGLMVAFQSARRAVACAQEIQRAVARRNRMQIDDEVELRIGLHTGEVISEDGDLHGETMILAKRIEEVAPPRGIFASDTVYGVLGTARSGLEDRGEFELKGIAHRWHVYEVPWLDAEATGVLPGHERTPFVGRAPERARLIEAVQRARDGHGSLLFVAGEVGVGKTRLTEEVGDAARKLGLQVLTGHCVDQQGAAPYLPWIELIEEAARNVSPDALRQALGENAPEIAKLMPALRMRFSDIPEPVSLPPEQERRYLCHAVSEFVERGKHHADPFGYCNDRIAEVTPAPDDPFFHPFLYGSGQSAKARAGFYGLAGWHTEGHVLRALFEGVVFEHRRHIEVLTSAGVAFDAAVMSGGGTRSPHWPQMMADCLGVSITVADCHETGALGAAIAGSIGAGIFADFEAGVAAMTRARAVYAPVAARKAGYDRRYRIYLNLVETMGEFWTAQQELREHEESKP